MALSFSKKAMEVKPSSTLAISAKAKELKAQGIDVVGFGAGEPDFNTPDNINQAAIEAIDEGFTKYTPASGMKELKEAISRKFKHVNHVNYEADQVVISNGGKHALTNVFTALINPGDEVIIPAPYWLSYPEIVKLVGGVPVIVTATKEENYKITAKKLQAAITDKTKIFVLNTPNNPTGMIYTRQELEELANVIVENDIYVLADEMYEYLIYGDEPHISIASLNDEIYARAITCSGVSKSYAMTGWRIGYTGSSKEIAKLMGSVQSHQASNPNSIAQKAALEAISGPQDTVETMRKEFDHRRKYIYKRICDMPLVTTVEPMGAFYVFVDVTEVFGKTCKGKTIKTTHDLADVLLNDYAVAVVPCDDFGFNDHIRLSYAISKEQIKKGMDRLETFLHDCK